MRMFFLKIEEMLLTKRPSNDYEREGLLVLMVDSTERGFFFEACGSIIEPR